VNEAEQNPLMSISNTTLTDEESSWINECCARLRLIQADAANALQEKRVEYLREEVERSLKSVPVADQKRYLQVLITRFPVAGQSFQLTDAPSGPEPETPEQRLENFFLMATKLAGQDRQNLIQRLQEAGLGVVTRDSEVQEISEDSRQKLGLAPGQSFDLARVVDLAALLVEEICALDKTGLKSMRELSARSKLLKRSENFRGPVSRFLTGQQESVEPQLQEIRGLLGGLLAALQGGGKDFGREFVAHLSPYAIEDVVEAEGASHFLGPNKKERCWDKYRDLAGAYATFDQIDRRIKDCLGAFVERLIGDKR
jgi:hypothetical protein